MNQIIAAVSGCKKGDVNDPAKCKECRSGFVMTSYDKCKPCIQGCK